MQGTRFSAAAFATSFPFSVEPVKQIISNGYLVSSTAASTSPSMTR